MTNEMITDLTPVRLANVFSLRLAGICPSLSCRGQGRVRALCGWPFPKLLRRPIRNWLDQSMLPRNRAQDYKNRSLPARHRARQTRPCSSRNQETDSAAARPPRLVAESPSERATRFDTADEMDASVHRA